MCTALTWNNGDFYFGRNMDIEYNFDEEIIYVPRNFSLSYKCKENEDSHYAMYGVGCIRDQYPLFAEAVNEHGLCIAGLNFPTYAKYATTNCSHSHNITPYELIPWLLGNCTNVLEVHRLLKHLNIIGIPFLETLPLAPLHWIITDSHNCIVVEPTKNGLQVFQNPVGILTNSPGFDFHLTNLENYISLNSAQPENSFNYKLDLKPLGQGLGAFGLPGDNSPTSRFVRAAFAKSHSICTDDEASNLTQFFHILDSVAMIKGNVITPEGHCDITIYTTCINVNQHLFYFKTYDNNQINCIDMTLINPNNINLSKFPFSTTQHINYVNRA